MLCTIFTPMLRVIGMNNNNVSGSGVTTTISAFLPRLQFTHAPPARPGNPQSKHYKCDDYIYIIAQSRISDQADAGMKEN